MNKVLEQLTSNDDEYQTDYDQDLEEFFEEEDIKY